METGPAETKLWLIPAWILNFPLIPARTCEQNSCTWSIKASRAAFLSLLLEIKLPLMFQALVSQSRSFSRSISCAVQRMYSNPVLGIQHSSQSVPTSTCDLVPTFCSKSECFLHELPYFCPTMKLTSAQDCRASLWSPPTHLLKVYHPRHPGSLLLARVSLPSFSVQQ